jgi:predicted negative regulator of RcsB-dependent stress response
MPKAIKKRVPKKSSASEEEVKEKLTSIKETIKERQQSALKVVIAVLVVIAALVSFLVYSYTSRKKARTLEYEAYKMYYSRPISSSISGEERYKKALETFQKAYAAKKSPLSLFYIAACYYDLGQYDNALTTLKDFIGRYSGDEGLIPLAYQKMALTQIKKGDTAGAKKTLDNLYALKGDIYKDFALMEYGKLLEREGKSDEAKKKYEELTKRFPDSPFIDEVKAKLAEKKQG